MKYKVGDKVRIKSIDWYNENKDEDGNIPLTHLTNSKYNFNKRMRVLCGKLMTISSVNIYSYNVVEDNGEYFWTDEMIECKVEEETSIDLTVKGEDVNERIEIAIPEGYEYSIESGKIIFNKKKKEYPKTYEECCKVLNIAVRDLDILDNMLDTMELIYSKNLDRLLNSFRKLLICRDAYWKLYGEEMGLGKPWEPNWTNQESPKYCIAYVESKIKTAERNIINTILSFPTAEMRDAFYENFEGLIESVKELL